MSFRDSPFDTEELSAEKLITSALSRLAATSKLIRVRVLFSKKRFTTVLPRSAGASSPHGRSPAKAAGHYPKVKLLSHDLALGLMSGASLANHHLVNSIGLRQQHPYPFGLGGWEVLSDKIWPDGKFTVPAVYQHSKFHLAWSSKIGDGV